MLSVGRGSESFARGIVCPDVSDFEVTSTILEELEVSAV
jgi:hypothetical protein